LYLGLKLKLYCPGSGGQSGGQGGAQQSAALMVAELTGLLSSPNVIAAVRSTKEIITMRVIFI
jgi:hypothetical protein